MGKARKSILVFASKKVGFELLKFLVKAKAPIVKVIAAREDDKDIVAMAKKAGIPAEIYSADTAERLKASGKHYDWLLNLWSPYILREDVLGLAEAHLNCHPSFVPHCQGNDNAAWAIRKQLPAGVSLLEMTSTIDAGCIYAQQKMPYSFPMSGRDLHLKLQEEMIVLFKKHWPRIFKGQLRCKPQQGKITWHRRRETDQDRVKESDEVLSLFEAMNWALAHDFFPGTTAEVVHGGKHYKVRCIVEEMKKVKGR